jgi:hypothetical protein
VKKKRGVAKKLKARANIVCKDKNTSIGLNKAYINGNNITGNDQS